MAMCAVSLKYLKADMFDAQLAYWRACCRIAYVAQEQTDGPRPNPQALTWQSPEQLTQALVAARRVFDGAGSGLPKSTIGALGIIATRLSADAMVKIELLQERLEAYAESQGGV